MFTKNLLLYGDNLAFLSDPREFPDESVDLIYLDPPFNSNANYNMLFREASGEPASAQIKAFKDTWQWDHAAAEALSRVHEDPFASNDVKSLVSTFHGFLGHSPMLAYLVQMAIRLVHMRRVLKETGSLYLHCDPTASHYLKLVLDGIFGPRMFRAEIMWKRSSAHSDTKQGLKQHGRIHDVILFYTKTGSWTWNPVYTPYDEAYLESEYRHKTPEGRHYKETDPTAAKPGGDTEYVWHVKRPAGKNGHRWAARFG